MAVQDLTIERDKLIEEIGNAKKKIVKERQTLQKNTQRYEQRLRELEQKEQSTKEHYEKQVKDLKKDFIAKLQQQIAEWKKKEAEMEKRSRKLLTELKQANEEEMKKEKEDSKNKAEEIEEEKKNSLILMEKEISFLKQDRETCVEKLKEQSILHDSVVKKLNQQFQLQLQHIQLSLQKHHEDRIREMRDEQEKNNLNCNKVIEDLKLQLQQASHDQQSLKDSCSKELSEMDSQHKCHVTRLEALWHIKLTRLTKELERLEKEGIEREAYVKQLEVKHQEDLNSMRKNHESRLTSLLPKAIVEDLEETIKALREQIDLLHFKSNSKSIKTP